MRIDKQLKKEFNQLVDKYGYWSKEVKNFNSKLDYTTMIKLNNSVTKR